MPEISLSFAAITMAVVTQTLWAFVWYGIVFRMIWIREKGVNGKRPAKPKMVASILLMMTGYLLMALSMSCVLAAFNPATWGLDQDISPGVIAAMVAVVVWAGFMIPVVLSGLTWGRSSLRLFAIHAGYYLFGLFVMAEMLTYL